MAKKKTKKTNKLRKKLTPMEECCCQHYVANGGNQSAAFRECHKTAKNWKSKTVNSKASTLFSQEKVRERVEQIADRLKDKYEITVDKLLKEMAIIAFADRTELFNDDKSLKPFSEMSAEHRRLIESIDVSTRFVGTGDEVDQIDITKIKTTSRHKALESLFKNKGLFEVDNSQKKPETNVNVTVPIPDFMQKMIDYGKDQKAEK